MTNKRCAWVSMNDPLMLEYHDREWGVPVHDDRTHFENSVDRGKRRYRALVDGLQIRGPGEDRDVAVGAAGQAATTMRTAGRNSAGAAPAEAPPGGMPRRRRARWRKCGGGREPVIPGGMTPARRYQPATRPSMACRLNGT